MWQILHRCSLEADPSEYASIKADYQGMKLTKMICTTCREAMYLVGHEPFANAVPWKPAGFAILATHKEQ